MAEERNDKWILIVLAGLAVAYFLYRRAGSADIDLGGLRRVVPVMPYLLPPLIAVLVNVWSRRRAAAMKAEWRTVALKEGLLREELGVKVSLGGAAGGGAFESDVRLTRAAFYIFDRSFKRAPMRVLFRRDSHEDLGVHDVRLPPRESGMVGLIRLEVEGAKPFTVELMSGDPEGWWRDIRRALGKSTRLEDADEHWTNEAAELVAES